MPTTYKSTTELIPPGNFFYWRVLGLRYAESNLGSETVGDKLNFCSMNRSLTEFLSIARKRYREF
jgi:hypothetical protein